MEYLYMKIYFLLWNRKLSFRIFIYECGRDDYYIFYRLVVIVYYRVWNIWGENFIVGLNLEKLYN